MLVCAPRVVCGTDLGVRGVMRNKTALAISTLVFATVGAGCVDQDDNSADDDGADVNEAAIMIHPDEDTAGSMIRIVEGDQEEPTGITPSASITQTPGMDVSSFQGNVAWGTAHSHGARFAYVKATEGTTYKNPYFGQQYTGSYNAGIIRGAYHFALPNVSSGATQAAFFVAHGGGWSNDGKTLPPAIDLEYNPYGSSCYGKSASAMVAWIRDFVNTVKAKTHRDPVIYTSTSWWSLCTGNNGGFGANPLWVARYASAVGTLPRGWSFYTIWQNADHGVFPGDHDLFNGAFDRIQAFAR
jgi:GH25 family lysozyme M1 (1,4-beta-N-acetylmuramidase)